MTEMGLRGIGTGTPMPETTNQTDGGRLHPLLWHVPIGDRGPLPHGHGSVSTPKQQ